MYLLGGNRKKTSSLSMASFDSGRQTPSVVVDSLQDSSESSEGKQHE